jgi:hypothetical protein
MKIIRLPTATSERLPPDSAGDSRKQGQNSSAGQEPAGERRARLAQQGEPASRRCPLQCPDDPRRAQRFAPSVFFVALPLAAPTISEVLARSRRVPGKALPGREDDGVERAVAERCGVLVREASVLSMKGKGHHGEDLVGVSRLTPREPMRHCEDRVALVRRGRSVVPRASLGFERRVKLVADEDVREPEDAIERLDDPRADGLRHSRTDVSGQHGEGCQAELAAERRRCPRAPAASVPSGSPGAHGWPRECRAGAGPRRASPGTAAC